MIGLAIATGLVSALAIGGARRTCLWPPILLAVAFAVAAYLVTGWFQSVNETSGMTYAFGAAWLVGLGGDALIHWIRSNRPHVT